MRDLLRLFTPPEWFDWNIFGKIAYVVVFVGLMIPVTMFAEWLARVIFP